MNYVPTPNRDDTTKYRPLENKLGMHHKTGAVCREYFENGLVKKYDCGPDKNDKDWGDWYPTGGYAGGDLETREFSSDDQSVLEYYFKRMLNTTKQDRLVIVEIGVSRNAFENTSVSVFLKNKRPQDVYLGIDIDDKSFLDDPSKNIHTVRCPSQDIDTVIKKMEEIGVDNIDFLMIDGWHSINQCYLEWEMYTQLLNPRGMVAMHDTNFHPGPYYLVDSIDPNQYDVYKHLWDIQDWGISVAVRRPSWSSG
jgi:Methyltransferase domain